VRRVLFDEDVPRQLRRDLSEFQIRTVQEEGWSSVKNGELLQRSSPTFDVFVTADKRLRHQQNISQYRMVLSFSGHSMFVFRAFNKFFQTCVSQSAMFSRGAGVTAARRARPSERRQSCRLG